MRNKLLCFIALLSFFNSYAQQDKSMQKDSTLKFSGYAEFYYTVSKNYPIQKPSFIYNHKRNKQLALNLAVISANYNDKETRANLGLMVGDYSQFNYEGEPDWTKFIYEANFGILISKKRNVWIDAGIFPSHIGFETPIANDCWSASRAIVSENSPYYETGIRLSGNSLDKKSSLAIYYLNGWQKIIKAEGISQPSFGLQYTYTPNDRFTFNYSNFIGRYLPDSLKSLRFYNDFYVKGLISKKWGMIFGFDFGTDSYELDKRGWWFAPVFMTQYKLNQRNSFSFRTEYFYDQDQIIIKNPVNENSPLFGCSINYDYTVSQKSLLRIEYKNYSSKNRVFENGSGGYGNNQNCINIGFSIKL